jgi:hypothetical protein
VLKRLIIALIFIVFSSLSLAKQTSKVQAPDKPAHADGQSSDPDTTQQPAALTQNDGSDAGAEHKKSDSDQVAPNTPVGNSWWGSFVRWVEINEKFLVASSTVVIGVFTIVLAVATGFLYCATRRLVEGAEDTAKRQLRAYVAAKPKFVSSFNERNFCWADFEIINVGTTPANGLCHTCRIDVFPFPLPDDFVFPELPQKCAKTTSFPNQPMIGKVFAYRQFTNGEITSIRNGSMRIYIYGEMEYIDIFGDKNITRFGASATGKQQMLENLTRNYSGTDLVVEMVAISEWNHAD